MNFAAYEMSFFTMSVSSFASICFLDMRFICVLTFGWFQLPLPVVVVIELCEGSWFSVGIYAVDIYSTELVCGSGNFTSDELLSILISLAAPDRLSNLDFMTFLADSYILMTFDEIKF